MRIVYLLFVLLMAGLLQGCFPVVATGVGGGVMMTQDRRTSGAFMEDEAIEFKALDRIGKQYKDMHVNVTSFNRRVLLSGEVTSKAAKEEIDKLVYSIENVRDVYNELAVAGATSLNVRSNDTLITSKVKMRFVADKRFSAEHVKVVTENGTVFLLGIVKRAEADAATEVASTTGGVRRVVRLFEYLD